MSLLQSARRRTQHAGPAGPNRPRRSAVRRGIAVSATAAALSAGVILLVPSAGADEVGDKRAEAARIADQLDALQARQVELGTQAERVGFEQHQAEQAVEAAEALLAQTTASLDERRDAVKAVAVEAYQKGNDSPELDAFLTSDPSSGVQKRTYLEARTSNIQDVIDELGSAQQKTEDDTARLERAKEAADTKVAEYEQLWDANEKAVADARALNARAQGELQTLVAEEQARRAAEQARVAERQAAQAQRESASSTPAPSRSTQGAGTGTPSAARGGSTVVVPSNPNPPPAGAGASGAIAAATSRVGQGSYVWGASGPANFDCSGLVLWAYAQAGRPGMPHYSGAMYQMTTRVSRDQLQAGDLVFWGGGGSEHVAIYMGGNQIVHSFPSGGGPRITQLDGWWKPPTGYGRLN